MKNFWSYITNGNFSVGCNGQTVYLYDKNNNEIKKFKDLIYAYRADFAPDGKSFIVKSNEGRIAVYSLETFSLIKKFRYTKFGDDDNFCFSPDSKFIINIEPQENNCLHSTIAIYNTSDFSLKSKTHLDKKIKVNPIEFDKDTNSYYLLGYIRGDDGVFKTPFIAKFENSEITDITEISREEYDFYYWYKQLQKSGFTEKAYRFSNFYIKSKPASIPYELDKLKAMDCSLAKLFKQKTE